MATGKINLRVKAGIVTGPQGLSILATKFKEFLPNGDAVYEVIREDNKIIGLIIAPKGDEGKEGKEGLQGIAGIGISHITQEKEGLTNKLTIHFTDLTTQIINILDGENSFELWLDKGNEGELEDFFEEYRGYGIKEVIFKETLANGDKVYDIFIENGKNVGSLTAPKGDNGNVNFATFEIIDGYLYATYTRDTEHMKFAINANGELEVTING